MKKLISALLALTLLLGCLPVSALAANGGEVCAAAPYSSSADLLEVTTDGAPIHTGPGKDCSTVVTCKSGAVLEKTGSTLNKYLHRWYEVTYRDNLGNKCYTGYIYSKNVEDHSHRYEKFEYEGVTYKFCDCGRIMVAVEKGAALGENEAASVAVAAGGALALPSSSLGAIGATGGALVTVDGPLPFGDLIALGLLITAGILTATGTIPTAREVAEVYEDVNVETSDMDGNSCPIDSYRKVSRAGGTLTCIDKKCMSVVEAYVWVRTGNDVWCEKYETALALASIYPGGYFSEIDASGKDYWYHFHLGEVTDTGKHVDVVGGHIFYGISAVTGQRPVGA